MNLAMKLSPLAPSHHAEPGINMSKGTISENQHQHGDGQGNPVGGSSDFSTVQMRSLDRLQSAAARDGEGGKFQHSSPTSPFFSLALPHLG